MNIDHLPGHKIQLSKLRQKNLGFLLFLTVSWIGFPKELSAQICTGNIGENIFTEGDFGSGLSNILGINPALAPGYEYTNAPPPNDGSYTLTNNIAQWSSAFGWLEIQDNSDDPNGYMMVVNASYDPGLFYEQEVEGLCENTLYVFSANIFNLIQPGSNLIKPNVSFLIDDQEVYSTGPIPENAIWNTYGFTFSTQAGQTSVTLSLQNNAPGGLGNDLALDNITFRPCGPEALILPFEVANICEDGSPIELEATVLGDQYNTPHFQWQQSFNEGLTWQNIPGATNSTYTHTNLSGGFYYYRYLLANDPTYLLNSKCRVNSNVKVVHVVPKFYTITDTLCAGLSFQLGNKEYGQTGVYTDSLITIIGCDSIVTLNLTIVPDPGIDLSFTLGRPSCPDVEDGSIAIDTIRNGTAPYLVYFNNQALSPPINNTNLAAGNYLYTIVDHYGCQLDTSVILQTPIPIELDLGPDWEIDLGDLVELNPTITFPATSYDWEPAGLINCTVDCENISWAPLFSTSLTLIARSPAGCIASDSIQILVNEVRKVYIPNAFSPNGDQVNDLFVIFADQPHVQEVEELLIFDRWGNLVYKTQKIPPNDLTYGWDGTFEGKAMDVGLYGYYAKVRYLDEKTLIYSGEVLLIR